MVELGNPRSNTPAMVSSDYILTILLPFLYIQGVLLDEKILEVQRQIHSERAR